jgi:hypothetical protein
MPVGHSGTRRWLEDGSAERRWFAAFCRYSFRCSVRPIFSLGLLVCWVLLCRQLIQHDGDWCQVFYSLSFSFDLVEANKLFCRDGCSGVMCLADIPCRSSY